MKILIDIGHPAHVHYFRNAINIMKNKGHEVLVTTRNKEFTLELLNFYNIPYVNTGRNYKSFLGKFFSIFRNDLIILLAALKFKPDIFVSFLLPFPAHVGFLLRKPVIGFSDTENAKLSLRLTKYFTNYIITPSCYMVDLGEKHIKFDGYMELCYLHPNYFMPEKNIKRLLGLKSDEKYVILRFVSWKANHDVGHKGISDEAKRRLVKELSIHAKVLISSEVELPNDLKKYRFSVSPENMHSAIAFSDLLVGESATMASEAACLGVPAIYHDDEGRGYTFEEENKYGLVFNFSESSEDQKRALEKSIELIKKRGNNKYQIQKEKLLEDKIDVTAFMVWLLEKYPESLRKLREEPEYLKNFNKKKSLKPRIYSGKA